MLYACILAFCIVAKVVSYWRSHRARQYPPGPPAVPFIGNLKDLPRENEVAVYAQWAKQYGMPLLSSRCFRSTHAQLYQAS